MNERHNKTFPSLKIGTYALLGTLLVVLWAGVFLQNASVRPLSFETIYAPFAGASTTEVFRKDFPDWMFVDSVGEQHDGTQFYVMARHLSPHANETQLLDRPQYRWQRPLYPALARMLYPPGQGLGLLWSFTILSVVSVFVGAMIFGAVIVRWGGTPKTALLYPLLPGVLMTLRWGLADTVALVFLLGALLFATRHKLGLAVAMATAACLTRETSIITVAGLSLWVLFDRLEPEKLQWRKAAALLLIPITTIGMWWMYLKATVEASAQQVREIVPPFSGMIEAINHWQQDGNFGLALFSWVLGAGLAVWAFKRGRFDHPLSWVVIFNAVFVFFLEWQVIGLSSNSTRVLMPLMAFSIIMITSKTAPKVKYSLRKIFEETRGFMRMAKPAEPTVRR